MKPPRKKRPSDESRMDKGCSSSIFGTVSEHRLQLLKFSEVAGGLSSRDAVAETRKETPL
jgi:hypothetical protein